MNEYLREILAGLLAGGMAAGTAIVTALQETALAEISDGQWLSIGIGGFLAAGAGWKTLLARSPKQ
jgi:hypothetical protein